MRLLPRLAPHPAHPILFSRKLQAGRTPLTASASIYQRRPREHIQQWLGRVSTYVAGEW